MKGIDEISTKQHKLIALLLTERTIDAACQKGKVAISTYWRWMQDERFLKEYRKARRGLLEIVVARLQSITFSAVDALERNLTSEIPGAQIRAAAIILEQSMKGLEMLDMDNRLENLEDVFRRQEERDGEDKITH